MIWMIFSQQVKISVCLFRNTHYCDGYMHLASYFIVKNSIIENVTAKIL